IDSFFFSKKAPFVGFFFFIAGCFGAGLVLGGEITVGGLVTFSTDFGKNGRGAGRGKGENSGGAGSFKKKKKKKRRKKKKKRYTTWGR
ncbi:hypothetical protein, partial [Bacillus anthracis]|uniref:hypothetical protein n=1 Tax=Bacillus anthracis TaxID=1392 RepID=UPI001A8C449E